MRFLLLAVLGIGLLSCGSESSPKSSPESGVSRTPSPAGAEVYFVSPADGDVFAGEVVVEFGIRGMDVVPAGTEKDNSGHHHLLIDAAGLPPLDQPMTDTVMHFGAGQTEAVLTLDSGTHTLQLILGDHFHIPHDPPVVSEKITITVE